MTAHKLAANEAKQFLLAGKAFVTFRSVRTGTRFTYKIRQAKDDKPLWFVSLLTGPDNNANYSYIGIVQNDAFRSTAKAKVAADNPSVKGFGWVFDRLVKGVEPKDVEVWHEGRCGRCGRMLTVPESIEQGYGPECIGLVRPSTLVTAQTQLLFESQEAA